jgi:hypothetical protein
MGRILDIGRRAEILPMDPRCGDITLALYRQEGGQGPVGLVHTYSSRPGAAERAAFVAQAMRVLGGLEALGLSAPGDPVGAATVRFSCGAWHTRAAKRLFLEACKVDPDAPLAARPLVIDEAKSGQRIRVEPAGPGAYRVTAEGGEEGAPSRAPAVARGLAKLAELELSDDPELVSFPCGSSHDALVGLLLPRALNVRSALAEEELKAARGVLSAPGAKESIG